MTRSPFRFLHKNPFFSHQKIRPLFHKNPLSHHKIRKFSSIKEWIKGTPIQLPNLPIFGRQKLDFGTCLMSFGATASLTGFLMTDVLYLRSLSVLGSTCGIIFNFTRKPKQLVAVGWGLLFISINLSMIARLLMERREIRFNVDEASLYHTLFESFGVSPFQFKCLMEIASWSRINPGCTVVENGKPLDKVLLVAKGGATCIDGSTGEKKYDYSAGENGCIIGATAVVEPERDFNNRPYPNKVIANVDNPDGILIVSFDRTKLLDLIKKDRTIESALVHTMYVDLLRGLRRNRSRGETKKPSSTKKSARERGKVLIDLGKILKIAVADEIIPPKERKLIREFTHKYKITQSELQRVLTNETGWSIEEFQDGAREGHHCFSVGSISKQTPPPATATMVTIN